jgi:ribonuclease R
LHAEIQKRRDFRSTPTFTIDPADAKDFDDALSARRLPEGGWEVGVHIADVAHYLKPGTPLDKEAVKRATSVYLVDRTIPMLPEVLSNDLCSLNPKEDKLAFSAVFTFNEQLELTEEWFGRAIIHSHHRFTYEGAQAVLNKKSGPYAEELAYLNQLAYQLRAAKAAAGAIAFERDEIKFVLDEAGRPLEVVKKERTDSHKLVEELMLLANRRVAEFVSKIVKNSEKKFVYRIHDAPDPEKIQQLADFLEPFGYRIKTSQGTIPATEINKLLGAVAGTPEENIVKTATMRSMSKAIYSMKNIGHYGLSFAHYAHFTSPIRRYPDVMVHRLLDYYLQGKNPSVEMLARYEQLALHSSQMEVQAQEAERDSIRYKQVEYMEPRVGQVFAATISGLAKWGIYVEEKGALAEGLVRLVDMKDDYYVFDEKNYSMVGERTGTRWRLGDEVKVKLLATDVRNRLLDFTFV